MAEYEKGFGIKWEDFKIACENISILEYLDRKGVGYTRCSGTQYNNLDFGDGPHDSFQINAMTQEFKWFSQGVGGKGLIAFVSKIVLGEVGGNHNPSARDIEEEIFGVLGRGDLRFPQETYRARTELPRRDKGSYLDYVPKNAGQSLRTSYNTYDDSFVLPPKASDNARAIKYLCEERQLDREIVDFFIARGDIYECTHTFDSGRTVHNVAFTSKDKDGVARACEVKYFKPYTGKDGKIKKSNAVRGSNKAYSFSYIPKGAPVIRCFEATIDALSWLSLCKIEKGDDTWKNYAFLVLEGVGKEWKFIPNALIRTLNENPDIIKVTTCFDNDNVGLGAANTLAELLSHPYGEPYKTNEDGIPVDKFGYPVIVKPYYVSKSFAKGKNCKDWNDTLKAVRNYLRQQEAGLGMR